MKAFKKVKAQHSKRYWFVWFLERIIVVFVVLVIMSLGGWAR